MSISNITGGLRSESGEKLRALHHHRRRSGHIALGRLLLRDLFAEGRRLPAPEEAIAAIEAELPDVILLDANFGRGATDAAEGFRWLSEIVEARPAQAVVVMITAHAGIGVASRR